MAYNIEKQLIPGLYQSNLKGIRYVVAHDSGNPNNVGANSLDNEISFMTSNWRNAFVSHWVGGGGRIVQLAQPGKMQYGAGPVANPYSYAHVELARTNSAATFKKDYAAYVWLLRKLATDAKLPKTLDAGATPFVTGIKTHDWIRKYVGGTTHTDPYAYLASHGISKAKFKQDIEAGTVSEPSKPYIPPKASKPTTSSNPVSLVDYLKSNGIDSSFTNRKRLAAQHGISNYSGTASQNTTLLNKLQSGGTKSSSKTSNSVVKRGRVTGDVWTQEQANFSPNRRVKVVKKGATYKVYDEKNGYYKIGGNEWINKKYMTIIDNNYTASEQKGKSSTKGDQKTTSLVDYLKSIGEDSSFSNRQKLASKYGIKNYKGTSSQNTQLLNKLR